ncbi:MAG: hypothetical protein IT578_06440 [Verrucomicrobiae bacterium]|nr:hypothetical protein [Verrucomicrobiae bacterium]
MNGSTSHNFLLIGLPSTGKTSFLAALWYAIQQTQSPTALVLKKLDGDCAYLNRIREAWLALKSVGRNPTDSETFVSMWLRRRESDEEVHLTFPDVSGESFKQQWAMRQLTATYDKCLQEANGGILFIHPDSMKLPLRIQEVDDLAAMIDNGVAEEMTAPSPATPPSTPVPWDIEKAPAQVQLVELLQFMMRRPYFRPPFRLAITVSAWDLVTPSHINPEDLVAQQLPLLKQFLSSHRKSFEVGFYGISAQGGKYEGEDMTALENKMPAQRIEIVGHGVQNNHDITEPILWLMQ